MPETRIVADETGYRLEREAPLAVEDWNAQVSLLTGMAAAEIMLAGGVGILRTMPRAEPEDVADFRAKAAALGIPWDDGVPYGEFLRGLDRASPAALAILDAAGGLFRGAGYTVLDGEVPDLVTQAAIAAPYAHTTAPLRRLVDRWSLLVCHALANGEEVPAEVRGSLTELPEAMERSSRVASQVDAAAIEHVAAAVLRGRVGEVFDAVVLRRRENGGRVALTVPPLETTVAGVDAEPGATIRLRLVAADVASGTVEFAPA